VLEKDARNFLERTPYQYINIRRDWSGKGVNGEVGSDESMARQKAVELTTIWKNKNVTSALKIRVMKSMVWAVFQYGVEGWILKKSDRNRIESFEMWCWRKILGISWKEHRTNISILEEIGLERELMGKLARMKLQYFGHVNRGSAGNLALSLGGQYRWFTSPRKTQQTMDGRHRRVEWL